jgi:SAM-dependent methyltransferase
MDLPQGALIHIKPNEIGKDDGRLDVMTNWMVNHKKLFEKRRILDLGSNCGHFPFVYSELGASDVIAVEGRKEFVDTYEIIKNLHYKDSNIKMLHSDIRDVDYSQIGKVDILSTIGIIYHVEGIETLLGEIVSAVKPEVWIVESQLWEKTHRCKEGGSGSDATQAFKFEEVLRPDAFTVEALINKLGFGTIIRFYLSDLYKLDSTCKDPRGFWLCIKKKYKPL